jgi:carbamoyl-phosphate synthase large subunit
MRSTGEVMGVGRTFPEAFSRAERREHQGAAGRQGLRLRARRRQAARARRAQLADRARLLAGGHRRHRRLPAAQGVACERINKVAEGRPHVVDLIKNGEIVYIINTTEGSRRSPTPSRSGARRCSTA